MKIVLLGPNGQVGWALQRALAPLGEVVCLTRAQGADLAQPDALVQAVAAQRPDAVVNAAAYTAVDQAEREPALAQCINAQAPAALAAWAAQSGAWLLHYSTDYVFDGSGQQPWVESAGTGPCNVYGASKLAGERAISASGARHLIFRTSWVYAARGGNFARTMLRLAQERERLSVIDDQHGAPTGADLIADVSAHALRAVLGPRADADLGGLYHLVAGGETTWHGYASWLIARARALRPDLPWRVQEIAAVPSSAFATPARRPLNSRLDTQLLRSHLGLELPHWQLGVARLLDEILRN